MTVDLIPSSVTPQFDYGVRLKHDKVRERYVVLGPEILIELNQTGTAIMSEIDGQSTITDIISRLAARFEVNPNDITQDVVEFCTSMVMRRVLRT
ncbi:MAG: pyrroloquinoline quinone biosynthesis peptide chaperone PqqD [Pseudomonadota bacterium]|nr:pyrroloquinoline quinone biosynthesis peptide chaperone PqqD [Pseudomonadota bacterium]